MSETNILLKEILLELKQLNLNLSQGMQTPTRSVQESKPAVSGIAEQIDRIRSDIMSKINADLESTMKNSNMDALKAGAVSNVKENKEIIKDIK